MLKMYLQKGIAAAAAAVMLVCSVSLEAFADSSVPESTAHKVFLAISAGTNMRWVPDDDSSAAKKNSTTGKDAVITGDGSYSVSAAINSSTDFINCLILSTDINAYDYIPDGASIPYYGLQDTECTLHLTVDSIAVQHPDGTATPLTYTGPSDGALRAADDGKSIQLNILNVWSRPNIHDLRSEESSDEYVKVTDGLQPNDQVVVSFTITPALDTVSRAEMESALAEHNTNGTSHSDIRALALNAVQQGDVYTKPEVNALVVGAVNEHNNSDTAHASIRVDLTGLDSRLKTLELKYGTNVTGSSFEVTFVTLTDVVVTGVWNEELGRIEF